MFAYPYCYYQDCNTPELRRGLVVIAVVVTLAAIGCTLAVWVQRRRSRRRWQ